MTNQIKNFIEEGEKELIQKVQELEPSGFNILSPASDNGYYLDEDKAKEWYHSSQISLIKMIVGMVESEKKVILSKRDEEDSVYINEYNKGLETIIRQLSNLRDEL